jgi:nucleoside-diphosphate-sugar epimerase
MKKKLLVCGATGFIGRNLVEHFARLPEYEVHATEHLRPRYACPGVEWIKADLTDQAAVEACVRDKEIVLHAAAITSGAKDMAERPHIHITDNAVMNSYLLRACHDHGVKHVVFFSCTVMYPSSETPLREEDFDANREIYPKYFGPAWTKVYTEKMCEFFSRLGGARHTCIRHSNIYGPYDKFDLERSHVLGATLTKIFQARDNRIVVWGAGEEARDVLYIRDLVRFVELALAHQPAPFRIYNAGAGTSVSIKQLVSTMIQMTGRPIEVVHDLTKPTLHVSIRIDCELAGRELHWSPEYTLEQGLRETIDWYQANQVG